MVNIYFVRYYSSLQYTHSELLKISIYMWLFQKICGNGRRILKSNGRRVKSNGRRKNLFLFFHETNEVMRIVVCIKHM